MNERTKTEPANDDQPIIIEVALNGATKKKRNPHVPISPEEVASDALACMDAGAAIVHQHDHDGGTSAARTAELSLDAYQRVLEQRPDALLYPTATFCDPVQERWGAHEPLANAGVLRIAYADPGSLNLGHIGAGTQRTPSSFVYDNSHADFAYMLEGCERLGLGPNIAIFEPGFLRVVLDYHHAGQLPAGAFVKFYFGAGGPYAFGFPPEPRFLDAYLDLLGHADIPWAIAVFGDDATLCGMSDAALERGGHLRVGLEDYSGDQQPTNVALVEQAVAAVEAAGRRPASPTEAAEILGLPERKSSS